MSIRVTCTGCHTRFNVNEKFAGKEGPCPKCKKPIKIPEASEQVEVHAPKEFGAKSAADRAVFKPIARKHMKLSPVQLVLIAATIIGFIAVAFLMKSGMSDPESFNSWLLVLAAIVLAIPCVYAGYGFLRNSELGGFLGQDLWTRVGICSVVYGLSWLFIPAIAWVMSPAVGKFVGMGLMFATGAAAAYLLLGIDFFIGVLHYGLFFGCCILLRVIAGFSAIPTPADGSGNNLDDILLEAAVQFGRWLV